MATNVYWNVEMDWENVTGNKKQAMRLFKQQVEMIFRKEKISDKQDQVD